MRLGLPIHARLYSVLMKNAASQLVYVLVYTRRLKKMHSTENWSVMQGTLNFQLLKFLEKFHKIAVACIAVVQ